MSRKDCARFFNTDALGDQSARGSVFTRDYQFTASAVSVLSSAFINDLRFQPSERRAVTRAVDTLGPGVEIAGLARFGRIHTSLRRMKMASAVALTLFPVHT